MAKRIRNAAEKVAQNIRGRTDFCLTGRTKMCLEPKHSSLNALSPSNYGSVRRKSSQRLPDPSDPPLNAETEWEAHSHLA